MKYNNSQGGYGQYNPYGQQPNNAYGGQQQGYGQSPYQQANNMEQGNGNGDYGRTPHSPRSGVCL
jgi:syntaxin 1B/2/3